MLKKLIGLMASILLVSTASAQDWPTRPMTLVVPFPAGGNADGVARVMANRMSEILGQRVIVENVGGAGGMVGSNRVAKAAPDGYTFVLGTTGTHAQSQSLYKQPLYDVVRDFTPVALVAEVPIALLVRKDLPVTNFKEFISYAKANQGKMQYGSAGPGSATHLGCVVLNAAIETDITHVPYRGSGPAMQDLLAGRIDFLCDFVSIAKPQVEASTIKALVLMAQERSPVLPNVPTTAEHGFPKLQAYTWNAVFLPKGTPPEIVRKLHDAIAKTMDTQTVREFFRKLGVSVVTSDRRSPDYLATFVQSEIDKWAKAIRASGVAAQ